MKAFYEALARLPKRVMQPIRPALGGRYDHEQIAISLFEFLDSHKEASEAKFLFVKWFRENNRVWTTFVEYIGKDLLALEACATRSDQIHEIGELVADHLVAQRRQLSYLTRPSDEAARAYKRGNNDRDLNDDTSSMINVAVLSEWAARSFSAFAIALGDESAAKFLVECDDLASKLASAQYAAFLASVDDPPSAPGLAQLAQTRAQELDEYVASRTGRTYNRDSRAR